MNSIKCPICEQTQPQSWGERNGYALYYCLSCTHRFADLEGKAILQGDPDYFRKMITNGLMSSDEEYYVHLASGEAPGKATAITSSHIFNLCRKNEINFSGSWLDIGCGSGYLLSEVQKAGFEAQGIEPGGWGQIAAKQKRVKIRQGFLALDTFSKHFDVVSATDVVEHLTDPVEFLRLMASYLVFGGHIVFSIPFADSFEAKLMGVRWDMVGPPTHCQFFSLRSLKLALKIAGLEIVDYQQYNIRNMLGLSKSGYWRDIVDALLPGPQLVCLVKNRAKLIP